MPSRVHKISRRYAAHRPALEGLRAGNRLRHAARRKMRRKPPSKWAEWVGTSRQQRRAISALLSIDTAEFRQRMAEAQAAMKAAGQSFGQAAESVQDLGEALRQSLINEWTAELDGRSMRSILAEAAERGIRGRSKMTRPELVAAVIAHRFDNPPT